MKANKVNLVLIGGCIACLMLSAGCATAKRSRPAVVDVSYLDGKYHSVKKGETLWSISRKYGMSLEEIVQINNIADASKIHVGQAVFIPDKPESVPWQPPATATFKSEGNFLWPVKGKIISHYGVQYEGIKSKGIRIQARRGEEIRAARSGIVAFCEDRLRGKGKTIIIDHGDGFMTVYSHNSENLVNFGKEVRQGEVIALAGESGRCDHPQLYFEIRRGHAPQNPFYYLP